MRSGLTLVPDWYTTFCRRKPALAMGVPPRQCVLLAHRTAGGTGEYPSARRPDGGWPAARRGLYDSETMLILRDAFNDMTLRHNSHFILIVRYNTVRRDLEG